MTNEKGKDAPGMEEMMKKMMSMCAEHGPAMKKLMAKYCSGKEGKFDCKALCERFLKGEKPDERKQASEAPRP